MAGRPPTRWLKTAMLALRLAGAPVPAAAQPKEDVGERAG
jgi:hypothetical protein